MKCNKIKRFSNVDDAKAPTGIRSSILKAPFKKVVGGRGAIFPWRSSNELLERLVPGSDEFQRKGFLLGGNVFSSNPVFDAYATAYLFMGLPLHKMLFFKHWQEDMAENMSWAFSQGVGVPFDSISQHDQLNFESGKANDDSASDGGNDGPLDHDEIDYMVEEKLRSLFESACKHGKESMQVKLECKPKGTSHMVSLFVFPFLSRSLLKKQPDIREKYQSMLEYMVTAPKEALPMYHEFVQQFQRRGYTENTVIAQVLVPCQEVFWVKDLATGALIQGVADETPRSVVHLVRMEMVVRTVPANRPLIPIKHEQGNWQITDIDDLLGGNLIL
eukprot:scaffold25296_cov162-Cylindrotheca_fusiformis.AAC.2